MATQRVENGERSVTTSVYVTTFLFSSRLVSARSASWFAPKVGQQVHLRTKPEYVACFMLGSRLFFLLRLGDVSLRFDSASP